MNAPFVRRARLVAAEAERDQWRAAAEAAIHVGQNLQRMFAQAHMTMLLWPYATQRQETGHEQPQPPTPE